MHHALTRRSFIRPATALVTVARLAVHHATARPFTEASIRVAFASVALSLAINVAPTLAANVADGALVFNNNCAACHQGGRNAVIPDHTLDQSAIEKFLDGGYSLDAIIYQVENGKGAMPAWADRLSEDEIRDVAQYVFETAAKGW